MNKVKGVLVIDSNSIISIDIIDEYMNNYDYDNLISSITNAYDMETDLYIRTTYTKTYIPKLILMKSIITLKIEEDNETS